MVWHGPVFLFRRSTQVRALIYLLYNFIAKRKIWLENGAGKAKSAVWYTFLFDFRRGLPVRRVSKIMPEYFILVTSGISVQPKRRTGRIKYLGLYCFLSMLWIRSILPGLLIVIRSGRGVSEKLCLEQPNRGRRMVYTLKCIASKKRRSELIYNVEYRWFWRDEMASICDQEVKWLSIWCFESRRRNDEVIVFIIYTYFYEVRLLLGWNNNILTYISSNTHNYYNGSLVLCNGINYKTFCIKTTFNTNILYGYSKSHKI